MLLFVVVVYLMGFGGLIVLCLLISLFCIHFDYLVCWFKFIVVFGCELC